MVVVRLFRTARPQPLDPIRVAMFMGIVGLVVAVPTSLPAQAEPLQHRLTPLALDAHMHLFRGGDVAAHWWQWATSADPARSPVRDRDGRWCSEGQDGRVWMLAGSFETEPIVRTCHIPAGQPIFMPIINAIEADVGDCLLATMESRRRIDTVTNIRIELDGEPVPAEVAQRTASRGCFPITRSGGRAVADGYWMLLAPPAPGRYTIHFRADMSAFGQDITYILEVGSRPTS